MEETFERVTERHGGKAVPVKHFYRRQYQIAGGDWRTIYYARFKDWKGKRRTFSLGSALTTAREQLTIYEARDIRREDFALDKKKADPEPERLTVARYIPRFLETKKDLAVLRLLEIVLHAYRTARRTDRARRNHAVKDRRIQAASAH